MGKLIAYGMKFLTPPSYVNIISWISELMSLGGGVQT